MLKVGAGTAGFARGLLLAGSTAAALCVSGTALAQDEPDASETNAATDGDADQFHCSKIAFFVMPAAMR